MKRAATCLWFDDRAEAAVDFYAGVFDELSVVEKVRTPDGTGAGPVLLVIFELAGQRFTALNGGPVFTLSEAASIEVHTDDQAENDRIWDAFLAAGAVEQQCGWLKDQFGLSWQIVPVRLMELMSDTDPARAKAGMDAMLKQTRIILADIEAAVAAA